MKDNTKSKNDTYAVRYDSKSGKFVYMNDDELLSYFGVDKVMPIKTFK